MAPHRQEGTPAAATADAPQTASQQFTREPNNPSTALHWLGWCPVSGFRAIEAVCREAASPASSRPRPPSPQDRIASRRDLLNPPATPD
jgi:hypothetical protein